MRVARLGLAVAAIGFAAVAYRAQIDGLGAATTHVRALATVRFNELAWLSSRAAELAEALYVQSAHDEARVWIRVSREHAGDEDRDARSSWMSVQAKLDAHAGDVAEAEALARAAVALVEATDALNRRAKTLLDLGEVQRLAGDDDAASESARKAISLYERKGSVSASARAREAFAVSLTT